MTRRSIARRGFALVELLILAGMLGLIALAGGRLFVSSMKLNHASAQAANAAAGFDAMTSVLRRDTWSAAEMRISADGKAVTLKSPDATISWTIGGTTIARSESGAWPIEGKAIFALDGPTLVLRVPASDDFAGGEIRFTSQVKLLAREP